MIASLGFLAAATCCSMPAFAQECRTLDVGVGLDAGFYSPGGTNTSFAGYGVNLRHPLDERLSLEASLGVFNAQNATFGNPWSVRAYPVSASVLGYLFPRSPLRLYGIAGGTLEHSTLDDASTGESFAWNRSGAHLGAGLELQTGRVTWQMDTRYILFGALLVAMMTARPQGLLGKQRVEIV